MTIQNLRKKLWLKFIFKSGMDTLFFKQKCFFNFLDFFYIHFKYINAKGLPFQIRHTTSNFLIQHFWFSGLKHYDYFRVFILILKREEELFKYSPASFSMPTPCLKRLWGTALITREQGKPATSPCQASWAPETGQGTLPTHTLSVLWVLGSCLTENIF